MKFSLSSIILTQAFTLVTLLVCFNDAFAQVKVRNINPSFFQERGLRSREKSEIPKVRMPKVDVEKLKIEDEKDFDRGLPPRFGKGINVDIGFNNGEWIEVEGGRVWNLEIISESAVSINLLFDQFFLPEGSELFLYNPDRTIAIGPITSSQNNESKTFGTGIVKGNSLVLELFEPDSVSGKTILNISKVVHGYKYINTPNNFGDSNDCNIDVNCNQGSDWKDESDAVGILIKDGERWCSGALLNNECQDLTPNFLTAFHCLDNGDGNLTQQERNAVQSFVFMFQYKSQSCNGPENFEYYSFSGSTFRAAWRDTDFALLELNQRPAASTGIKYAGWSRSTNTPTSSISLHHPQGDVMKISIADASATSNSNTLSWTNGTTSPPHTHWGVVFTQGTAEGGSSGGPLFDSNHRVVGQLHGGPSGCPPITKHYGRFDRSWNGGGTDDTRLSTWLSRNSSITHTNTISIPSILGSSLVCGITTFNVDVPPNTSVRWDNSTNLTEESGRNTPEYRVKPASTTTSGSGWVEVVINRECGDPTVIRRTVWIGEPNLNYVGKYGSCYEPYFLYRASRAEGATYTWSINTSKLKVIPDGYSATVVDNGMVDGTSQSFTVTVKINDGGCTFTKKSSRVYYKPTLCDCGYNNSGCGGSPGPPSPLSIHPVPSDDQMTISVNSEMGNSDEVIKEVSMFNHQKNLVLHESKINKKEFVIDVRQFPKGLYYIHIRTQKEIKVRQIIIE